MKLFFVRLASGYCTDWHQQWVLFDEQDDLLAEAGRPKLFATLRDIETWAKFQGDPHLLIIWPARGIGGVVS